MGVSGLVLLGGWTAWHFSTLGHAQADLDHELVLAKSDGLALGPDEIRSASFVPDSQNAAPLLHEALEELKGWRQTPDGKRVSELSRESRGISSETPAAIEEIRPILGQLTHLFEALDRAVKLPKIDFHRRWEDGPALLFPEFADEKGCVSLLLLKAKSDSMSGNVGEALHWIDTAAKLSALAGQDPIIIGLLVQVGMRMQVCDVLGGLVRAHGGDPAVLKRARGILKDLGPVPDVRPAIRSEFVMGRLAVRMLANKRQSADMFGSDGGNGVTRLASLAVVRNVYELRYTEVYRQLYQALSQNPASIVSMTKSFAAVDADMSKKVGKDWTYGLTELLAPVFGGLAGAIGDSEANRNVLLASLDLLEYKNKNGVFPAKLLGETGDWQDPFTEKPLIYRPTTNGFLLYSVARDGQDDGGRPRNRGNGDERYDIPFAYP